MSADKYPSIFSRQMEAIVYIFHIFVPNLGEIYQLGHKIAFSVKLRPIYGHGS